MFLKPVMLAALGITCAFGFPSHSQTNHYIDWKTFKGYGVNLGG